VREVCHLIFILRYIDCVKSANGCIVYVVCVCVCARARVRSCVYIWCLLFVL
jgi:hypothetical protein